VDEDWGLHPNRGSSIKYIEQIHVNRQYNVLRYMYDMAGTDKSDIFKYNVTDNIISVTMNE
jgi:hypothetical protein